MSAPAIALRWMVQRRTDITYKRTAELAESEGIPLMAAKKILERTEPVLQMFVRNNKINDGGVWVDIPTVEVPHDAWELPE